MSASAEHAAEVLQADLASISTKDLFDELAKRDGVNNYSIDPHIRYVVEDETGIYTSDTGPAFILVVIDQ